MSLNEIYKELEKKEKLQGAIECGSHGADKQATRRNHVNLKQILGPLFLHSLLNY